MRNEQGFTLIELLVVVAIIGILAAIAIPQFQQYRMRGFDAGARADLRNAATAEEAYFIDNDTYATCASSSACIKALDGLDAVSSTVTLAMTGSATAFTGTSTASSGSGVTYSWNSSNGGMQ